MKPSDEDIKKEVEKVFSCRPGTGQMYMCMDCGTVREIFFVEAGLIVCLNCYKIGTMVPYKEYSNER